MASKTLLDQSLSAFAGDLLSFSTRVSHSIYALKRTVEQRPAAGVQDFKECLDELEQQVAEFATDIEQLVECTADTTSLEELIGHCTAVYNSNMATAQALEQHLIQYGYQQPAAAVREPENPDELMQCQDDMLKALDAAALKQTGSELSYGLKVGSGIVQNSDSGPSSPGVWGSKSGSGTFSLAHISSRLDGQPGSPEGWHSGPAAGILRQSTSGPSGIAQSGGSYGGVRPAAQHTQQTQHERISFGTASSTPPGLVISPGVAALASKYATSSVGGSSVGGISVSDCERSTGPTAKHAAFHNMNLTSDVAGTNTCNQFICSHTANVLCKQLVSATGTGACDADAAATTPDQTAPAAIKQHFTGTSDAEDTTGQLYSSLIQSNFGAVPIRDVDMQDDQAGEPVTPPAASCPGTPKAPATAGRLPAEWHSKKMQELNDLQVDLTVTLSQMKRTPSRTRLAHLAAEELECEQDSKQAEQHQQQHQLAKYTSLCSHAIARNSASKAAVVGSADVDVGDVTASEQQRPLDVNVQRLRQQLQEEEQPGGQCCQTVTSAGTVAGDNATKQTRGPDAGDISVSSTHGGSSGDQRTAAAAATPAAGTAATAADIDSWMDNLSKKYAAEEDALDPPTSGQEDMIMGPTLHGSEGATSPDADALSDAVRDPDSLTRKYAALAIHPIAADKDSTEDGSLLLPPPAPSCSPKQQLSGSATAALLQSSAGAVAAAAAACSSAVLCSVASDVSATSDGTPGKPRLAAALAAGMAAFHSALRMDCPSPLSPNSPATARLQSSTMSNSSGSSAPAPGLTETAGFVTLEGQACEQLEATVDIATAADEPGGDHSAGVGGTLQQHHNQHVLTPATQQAIRHAVATVGIDSAQPKSSIRLPQPTTDMKRLQDMRCYWQSMQQKPQQQVVHQGQHAGPQQEQQQLLQRTVVINLEERLVGAADTGNPWKACDQPGCLAADATGSNVAKLEQDEQRGGTTKQASSTSSRQHQEQQHASMQPHGVHLLRGSSNGTSAKTSKSAPDFNLSVAQQQQQQLTPRAARLLRRQQQQEQQLQRLQGRKAAGIAAESSGVLRSVENLTHSSTASSTGPGFDHKLGLASSAAAVEAQGSPITANGGGSASKRRPSPSASTVVLVKVKPVTQEEFDVLPGWCRGLLTVDVLNSALQELSGLATDRAKKCSREGFTASDLEMLGHSSSKSKTIVSCLHKLSRATLHRSAAGSNVYKLIGMPIY